MGATSKTIILRGDKKTKAESAEHHIEFPGGCVSVCRCDDDTYWAHITAHRRQSVPGGEGLTSKTTTVLDGRLDYAGGAPFTAVAVADLPDAEHIEHIAIRIGPCADVSSVPRARAAGIEVREIKEPEYG